MTYSYAVLTVSSATYAEIRAKLDAAGYEHIFYIHDGAEILDMHGIALQAETTAREDAP